MTLEIVTHAVDPWPEYRGWQNVCVGCAVRLVEKLPKDTLIQFGPWGEPFDYEHAPELICAIAVRGYRVRIITAKPIPDRAQPFLAAGKVTEIVQDPHHTYAWRDGTNGILVLFPNGDVRVRMREYDHAGGLSEVIGNAYDPHQLNEIFFK